MRRRDFLSTGGSGAAATVLPGGAAAGSVGTRAPAPMTARMADEEPANYLTNTKIFNAPRVYGHTEAVIDLLTELGVRTIGERVTTGRSQGTREPAARAMAKLAAQGCRWHATVGRLEDWPNARAVNKEVMDLGKTVPEWASAIYAVRWICDFQKRDAICGRFELLDDPDPSTSPASAINRTADREAHFGLVAMTKATLKGVDPGHVGWKCRASRRSSRRGRGWVRSRW